jgi:DNA polymerase-1
MKELYVLDGYSLIYRSYFAFIRNPLRDSKGNNTSAIFGFFRSLFTILSERNPDYFVIAQDSMTPTFRHEKYPDYKITREKTPPDLHAQIEPIEEILELLAIPMIRVNGYEADDIIAALAARCRKAKQHCYIISGDKDLLQLAGDGVQILKPDKSGFSELGREEVHEGWGVYPEQIRDYLALVGDSSDNVPGVKGIGAKTAVKLLEEYESLDGVYEHLESISSASWKKKLEENRENAYLSRDLVRLETEVPLPLDLEELKLGDGDKKAAAEEFLRFEINSLAEELSSDIATETGRLSDRESEKKSLEYEAVTDEAVLDAWVRRLEKAGTFAFDCETDSLDALRARPVGFSFSDGAGTACYIPLKAAGTSCLAEDTVRKKLKGLLENEDLALIGQNIKYDYKVLKRWGIGIQNIAFDTMVAAWLLDSTGGPFNMDNLAERHLSYKTVHFSDIVEKGELFESLDLDQALSYAAEDADITYRLYECFEPQLKERGLYTIFSGLDIPLITVLAEMELAGIFLHSSTLNAYGKELEKTLSGIEAEIFDLCEFEFNIASTKQLQEVLFEKRKLTPVKKTKTGFSTDTSVLQILAAEDPVPALVLRHRLLSKLKSTYVDALPKLVNAETKRIHTHFNLTGTATGRLSSTDPNLQNIPIRDEEGRRIRQAFIPEKGKVFISADYSQIELVILAHLSKDEALKDAFLKGGDVHARTAALIFDVAEERVDADMRRIAKTINFGVMYGMSAFRLSRELGIPRAKADDFITAYFERYCGVKAFIENTVRKAEQEGKVYTIMGRERRLPTINSKNKTEKMAAERIAVNTPIQGSAADIVKAAMLDLDRKLAASTLQAKLLLQVHDELILETAEEDAGRCEELVRGVMENAVTLEIPLRVNIERGMSWGDLH